MDKLSEKREGLYPLCEEHKVERLYVFGSVLTEKFDPGRSDLDFLVELLPLPSLERGEMLISLWSSLEALFSCKVDLLTEQSLKNLYLIREIESTRKLIYDRKSQEVLMVLRDL